MTLDPKLTPTGGMPADSARADEFVVWLLRGERLIVDSDNGAVYRADGITRAETPIRTGYGIVYLGRYWGRQRFSGAHRVVWIAVHGPIPGNYQINHRNGHRWDNRLTNLDMVTPADNARHAHCLPYEHVPGVPFLGADDRPVTQPILTGSVMRSRRLPSDY